LGKDGWAYATDTDQITLTSQQSGQRISLTSPAMLLALVVFLLEQVLGNRFYRSNSFASRLPSASMGLGSGEG
jgi:hypothetical protein